MLSNLPARIAVEERMRQLINWVAVAAAVMASPALAESLVAEHVAPSQADPQVRQFSGSADTTWSG